MPILPEVDFFGYTRDEQKGWQMHHYAGKYNDKCVIRLTTHEHARIEAMMKKGDYRPIDILLATRERTPLLEPGMIISAKGKKNKTETDMYKKSWKKNGDLWVLKEGIDLLNFYKRYNGVL
jgi:hypothetical protein